MESAGRVLLFLLLGLMPASLSASELSIRDSLGLLRARARIENSATVVVSVHDSTPGRALHPEAIMLKNVDKISSPIPATGGEAGKYQFENVSPGRWEVELPDPQLTLGFVRIQPEETEVD